MNIKDVILKQCLNITHVNEWVLSECSEHRTFLIDHLLKTKIHRSCKELSRTSSAPRQAKHKLSIFKVPTQRVCWDWKLIQLS